jgi:pyruvate dehydrogenase complex dehydrogenase (E1) component
MSSPLVVCSLLQADTSRKNAKSKHGLGGHLSLIDISAMLMNVGYEELY